MRRNVSVWQTTSNTQRIGGRDMLSIYPVVLLGFLFAIGIAVIILRWMREAEEVIETASDRAAERISNVTDRIATGGDGLSEAIETRAK